MRVCRIYIKGYLLTYLLTYSLTYLYTFIRHWGRSANIKTAKKSNIKK